MVIPRSSGGGVRVPCYWFLVFGPHLNAPWAVNVAGGHIYSRTGRLQHPSSRAPDLDLPHKEQSLMVVQKQSGCDVRVPCYCFLMSGTHLNAPWAVNAAGPHTKSHGTPSAHLQQGTNSSRPTRSKA